MKPLALAEIKAALKDMLVDRLSLKIQPESIADDARLFRSDDPDAAPGLDLDSVEALEVVVGIEQRFGVVVPEGDYIAEFASVETLAAFVQKLMSDSAA